MKNNPETKNEITYELDELLAPAIDGNSGDAVLLIKHDYYASNSDHGRELLASILDSITNYMNIKHIYLIDSGVKLLNSDNPVCDILFRISVDNKITVTPCLDSVDYYKVQLPDFANVMMIADELYCDFIMSNGQKLILE